MSVANNVLSCHFDGVEGSTALVDVKGHVLTASGKARITQTQKVFGSGSLLFDGGGGLVSSPDSDDWHFGSGDFTIAMWVLPTSISGPMELVSQRNGTLDPNNFYFIRITPGGALLVVSVVSSAVTTNVLSIPTISTGVWTHVAVTRSSGVVKTWIGGVNSDSVIVNTNTPWPDIAGAILSIGSSESTDYFKGCIDDLVITKECLFTSNFTPPTQANADSDYVATGFSSTQFGTPTAIQHLHAATGFSSTHFGLPSAAYGQAGAVSGIAPTVQFGTPSADFARRYTASGLVPATQFGTPSAAYPQAGVAKGFKTTRFGRPQRLIVNYAPSIGVGARFGTPKCKLRFVGQAASCPVSTHFGVPIGRMNTVGKASSIHSIAFGVPTATYAQLGVVAGFSSTRFGTPRRPRDESLDTLFVFQKTNRVDVWSDA